MRTGLYTVGFVTLLVIASCTGVGRDSILRDLDYHPEEVVPETESDDVTDDLALPEDLPGPDLSNMDLCEYSFDGTLVGVSIDLSGNQCQYTLAEAAAGIKFTYRIIIETPLEELQSLPLDAGHCDETGPAGLKTLEKIHGNDQSYCVCDLGLCDSVIDKVDLVVGEYADVFEWEGTNWNGPSDTGNPKGAPFPPGEYTLVIRAEGKVGSLGSDFAVTGTMKIILTD
jgi:hypothetical protein